MVSWQIMDVHCFLFRIVEGLKVVSNTAVLEIAPNGAWSIFGRVLIEFQEVFKGQKVVFILIVFLKNGSNTFIVGLGRWVVEAHSNKPVTFWFAH
jgi:hypothetical protein